MDNDLFQFSSIDIPPPDNIEDGFLEIINQQHRETINSRIYAYFLDTEKNKAVAQLFLSALLALIQEKAQKTIELEDFVCYTEVSTGQGRIDLVIENHSKDKAIIIENKLFYHLHNDLLDYWNNYSYAEENKVGILLTLEQHAIPIEVDKYFINITHLEWIRKIQAIGLPSQLPSKYYVYLNDFFQTIQNLTMSDQMNEQTRFYFQHSKKILRAQETIQEAHVFMNNQLTILAAKLGLSVFGKSMEWRNIWDEAQNKNVYYTIVFGDLLRGEHKIQIIIELFQEQTQAAGRLRELLKENKENEVNKLYKAMNLEGQHIEPYLHFAQKTYELSLEDIENFAEFVHNKIDKEFEPVMAIIDKELYPTLS